MKENKGITLTVLIITIVIMAIITSTVTYNTVNYIETKKLKDMYNDLSLIEDKLNLYYSKYGVLPVKEKYVGNMDFEKVKNPNDNENYYIIDLALLDGITLNNKIEGIGDDLYIVNEETHTIYYPKGIMCDNSTYYRLEGEYTLIP